MWNYLIAFRPAAITLFLLIRYHILSLWSLTFWSWKLTVCQVSCNQLLYQNRWVMNVSISVEVSAYSDHLWRIGWTILFVFAFPLLQKFRSLYHLMSVYSRPAPHLRRFASTATPVPPDSVADQFTYTSSFQFSTTSSAPARPLTSPFLATAHIHASAFQTMRAGL